jgi:cytoskeleton protein RodZ
MDTLGLWLRQTREAKGSTLAEASVATRIRVRFLDALEAGDFAAFPGGDVQVRGFLRIYARYLGLSPDKVMARYDAEVHGIEAAPSGAPAGAQPPFPSRAATRPLPPPPPAATFRPRRFSVERLLLPGIVLIALLAVVAGVGYLVSRNAGEEAAATATATRTAPAEAAQPSTAPAKQTSPLVTPTLPADSQGGVTLALEAAEHVWARVTADGRVVFEGMLAPGQVEAWSGQGAVTVDTGNGAGLLVTVNGQPQGAMCGRAQVCTRSWEPTGEIPAP